MKINVLNDNVNHGDVDVGQVRRNQKGWKVLVVDTGECEGLFNAVVMDGEIFSLVYWDKGVGEGRINDDYPILLHAELNISERGSIV